MRNRHYFKWLSALAATLIFAAAGSARAGEPTVQVRAGIDSVLTILQNPELKGKSKKSERRMKLREAIGRQFDFAEMSRRSLARQWRKRSDEEKNEFIDLFSRLIEKTYIGKIEAYTDEKVQYTKEVSDKEFARVNTMIVTKRKKQIAIVYSLHMTEGKWRVYDVVVKGVSLVNTYRQQFRSIIRKSSYAGLVKILRKKKEKG
jgi:phospholipid transport system substrate-binding protein